MLKASVMKLGSKMSLKHRHESAGRSSTGCPPCTHPSRGHGLLVSTCGHRQRGSRGGEWGARGETRWRLGGGGLAGVSPPCLWKGAPVTTPSYKFRSRGLSREVVSIPTPKYLIYFSGKVFINRVLFAGKLEGDADAELGVPATFCLGE